MESTTAQETQVKEATGVNHNGEIAVKQPEAVRPDVPSPLVGNLETAFKEALDEIRHCDEQANLWLSRKSQIQAKMNESLANLQKQVGAVVSAPAAKPAPKAAPAEKSAAQRIRVDKNASVPDLIRTFLEKHGPARTRDIRKFLLSHGRKTSPGVSLGRMVKKGDIKNVERGIYEIA